MTESQMKPPNIVSRDEWLVARKELLATRVRDALRAERRGLPMVEIEKEYTFEGPDGPATLVDLFEGRRQLIVQHFMFDPSWDDGCPSCTYALDDLGHLPHDGKAMLDAISEHGCEAERRQIAENRGRWPAPDATEVAHERDLSAEQARWLAERFVGRPGRTVSEPAVLNRPLAQQRATYIVCTMEGHSASDDVAAMREEPNWTFRTLETGHWPMVSAPDELVALLAEVASEHG